MTFDERLALLERQVKGINSTLARSNEQAAAAEAAKLDRLLAPSLLPPSRSSSGDVSGATSLGSALMDRLRADSGLSLAGAGSTFGAVASANLLHDPGLAFLPQTIFYQLSTWRDAGNFWQTYLESVSGDAPGSPAGVSQALSRDFWATRAGNLGITWASYLAKGVARAQMRSIHPLYIPTTPDASPVNWPYITASCRVFAAPEYSIGPGTWDFENHPFRARVKILDGDDLSELAVGDWTDIGVGYAAGLEGRPYAVLEGWDAVTAYAPMMSVEIEVDSEAFIPDPSCNPATSVFFRAYFGEPSLNYSEEPGPAPFQPQLGRRPPHPDMLGAQWSRNVTAHTLPTSTLQAMLFSDATSSKIWDHGFRGDTFDEANFYLPADGYYDVSAYAQFDAPGNGDQRVIQLYRGASSGGADTLIKTARVPPVASTGTNFEVRHIIPLTHLHRMYATIWQNSGSTLSVWYIFTIRYVASLAEEW